MVYVNYIDKYYILIYWEIKYANKINIAIDVDGSPSGYISWHNHFYNKSRVRVLRPIIKNERFGVQRMEMLAVYFAILDSLKGFKN